MQVYLYISILCGRQNIIVNLICSNYKFGSSSKDDYNTLRFPNHWGSSVDTLFFVE